MTRKHILVALVALSMLLAGCAGPGGEDDNESGFAEQTPPTNDTGPGQATPDNDVGAEPVNPPAGENENETDERGQINGTTTNDTTERPDGSQQ